MEVTVTEIDSGKQKDTYLFELNTFVNSFDKQLRELLSLQQNVIEMLRNTVKRYEQVK